MVQRIICTTKEAVFGHNPLLSVEVPLLTYTGYVNFDGRSYFKSCLWKDKH